MKSVVYKSFFWLGVAATAANLGLYIDAARYVAIVLFGSLFIMALFKKKNEKRFGIFLFWFIQILIGAFVSFLRYENINYAIQIAMPLMICYSSTYLFDNTDEDLIKWFTPFSVFFSFCAFMSIWMSNGSFDIVEYYLEDVAKNQICPFFAIISILAVGFLLHYKTSLTTKVLLFIVALINILPSIVLVNRTSLIGFGFVCVFLVYIKGKIKGLLSLAIIVGLVMLLFGSSVTDVLYESIVGNRDATDMNSLTSGRTHMNEIAIGFIGDHFLFGEMGGFSDKLGFNPHVFVLYNLVRFGFLGGLPFFVLYGSIIWILIKAFRKRDLLCAGVLLIAVFESLAEYSSPFGPGTTFVLCYIIVGKSIKNGLIKNQIKWSDN